MTASTLPALVDGDATLRPLGVSDLETTLSWRNDPRSRTWFHDSDPVSGDRHRDWFDRYLTRDDDYVFILDIAGVAAAQASLYGVADGTAEFGRLLVDPAQRGRGFSHRIIALCLRVADDDLRLDRVHLEVKRDNARAIRGYLLAGFREDSTREGAGGSLVMERLRP